MSRSHEDDEVSLIPTWFAVMLIIVGASVVALVGTAVVVAGRRIGDEVSREVRTYAVVGIDPPKHFGVDLRDTGTGEVQRGLSVSKHCNRWRELVIGTEVQLERVRMQPRNGEPHYYKIIVSPGKLCPGYGG